MKYNLQQTNEILFRGEYEGKKESNKVLSGKRYLPGLQLMRQTESGLVIPNPISFNKQGILMEYIEFGKSSEYQFGVCLAKMHLHNRNSTNQGNIFART